MSCEFLNQGNCQFTDSVVGIALPTVESVCTHCLESQNPKQLNKATASLCAGYLIRNGLFDESNELHIGIRNILSGDGPGTKLRLLISWLPVPRKTRCRSCKSLEAKMNAWGSVKCRDRMDYILKKLRIAALRRSIPFVECAVRELVLLAISQSERAGN